MSKKLISTTTATEPTQPTLDWLDVPVASGSRFRVWMLLALILAILLMILIIICCVIKIRIPRSKREIELMAAQRRKRRPSRPVDLRDYEPPNRGCKVIVMSSGQSHLLLPPGPDAESVSCTSCATSDPSRNHTPMHGSKESLHRHQSNENQPTQNRPAMASTKYTAV